MAVQFGGRTRRSVAVLVVASCLVAGGRARGDDRILMDVPYLVSSKVDISVGESEAKISGTLRFEEWSFTLKAAPGKEFYQEKKRWMRPLSSDGYIYFPVFVTEGHEDNKTLAADMGMTITMDGKEVEAAVAPAPDFSEDHKAIRGLEVIWFRAKCCDARWIWREVHKITTVRFAYTQPLCEYKAKRVVPYTPFRGPDAISRGEDFVIAWKGADGRRITVTSACGYSRPDGGATSVVSQDMRPLVLEVTRTARTKTTEKDVQPDAQPDGEDAAG